MRYFIITVDTEGDGGWFYHEGDIVKTENSLAIPKFQTLCEKYGLRPVYLTNYEMVSDDRYVNYIREKAQCGLCEVGIHVHAWNNPPKYELERKYTGNPYLIEYPSEIMRMKFETTYNLIRDRIGIAPVSHRAGRWVMNESYFRLLEEFDIKVDCSYTPEISWSKTPGATVPGGSDYSKETIEIKQIGNILEVPITISSFHTGKGSFRTKLKYLIKGNKVWLRPAITSVYDMKRLIDKAGKIGYVEFMIHSSELIPGGSPYFRDEKSIVGLYSNMEEIFRFVQKLGFIGITLKDFAKCHLNH